MEGKQRWGEFGEISLILVRSAKAGAAPGRLADGLDHGRKRVAQNHWPPGAEAVQVAVAVRIPQVRAVGPLDKRRIAPDRAKRSHRRIHAPRQQARGPRLQLP